MKLSIYRKTIVALFGATVAFITIILADDQAGIQPEEALQGLILYGTALGVYALPNAQAPVPPPEG